MTRLVPLVAVALWVGSTLVCAELRWSTRRNLHDRVRPYVAGNGRASRPIGVLSVASFRDVLAPVAHQFGDRLAQLGGVHDDVATRLHRVHDPDDPITFRLRQFGWSLGALLAGAAATIVAAPPPLIALLLVAGSPTLTFLVIEDRLQRRSVAWQRAVFDELPVAAEQLGMLLSSGYSIGAAVARLGRRGHGAVARDLRRVSTRAQQGLSDTEALREWADGAGVEEVHDLVAVLALDRETTDLGRLVSDEAHRVRNAAHRLQIERIERRAQQVWIPVTVAALVPGVLFLAAPFLQAMQLFSGG
ncbi:MAG: type II secretion system F family protein [Acidimicrobiales bacterium]|nr:type II secretion system F family protein [Acidimicrobiales bacterium]MCB1248971.1 type II secretion system F family protein [Acidimicrobiales bacterium]